MASSLLSLLSITSFFLFFMFVRAQVPPSEQFRYVNDGEFGESTAEYGANYRVLEPIGHPFRLCFYNITPNAFFLAIRMGTESSESIMRWVWEANRNEPVRDQATLTFATDGNLVLADADGKVAWQTGTANRGVVGLKLLENGNLVLFNADGQFVWQSFDFPTDTLLVGQSLRLAGSNKLLSRDHELYNLVLEPKRLVLSYSIPKTNKSVVYFVREGHFDPYTTLRVEPGEGFSTQLSLITPGLFPQFPMRHFLARPRFNATLSFLRLDVDGNLRIYTYDFQVSSLVWEVTFELFDRDRENECLWPSRCGEFGLCEESQCVACPTEKVPLGWSKACKPKKIKSCDRKTFHYYKLEGVDHFMTKYDSGFAVGESICRRMCTEECQCLGYFYDMTSSRCWVAYDLRTIAKVGDVKRVAYVKTSNV